MSLAACGRGMPPPADRCARKNRGITIHEMFEPDLPRLWADERALRQVCLNLLSNAIKFTPSGGEVWLKVGWTASGGQYMSVKDTGPGIPEEEIPIVLPKFGQGSNCHQVGRARHRPRPADRQEPDRPAWRHVHAEIEGADRHRGDRHLPAGAGDGGAAAAGGARAADPAAAERARTADAPSTQALAVPCAAAASATGTIAFRARDRLLFAAVLIRRHHVRVMAAIETPCEKICIVDPAVRALPRLRAQPRRDRALDAPTATPSAPHHG